MADEQDRIDLGELGAVEPDERSGVRRLPYALLAAAGVGVATACAALASFAVASSGDTPGSQSPPVVSQVNDGHRTTSSGPSVGTTESALPPSDSGTPSGPSAATTSPTSHDPQHTGGPQPPGGGNPGGGNPGGNPGNTGNPGPGTSDPGTPSTSKSTPPSHSSSEPPPSSSSTPSSPPESSTKSSEH
jgi:hypothetical protein